MSGTEVEQVSVRVTRPMLKALGECWAYTNDGRPYIWMPKTMKRLADLGYARAAEVHDGMQAYVLTPHGERIIGKRQS